MPSNEQRRQAAKRKLERQLARRAERARRRRRVTVIIATSLAGLVAIGVVLATTLPGGGSSPAPAAASQGCDFTATPQAPAAKPVDLPPLGPAPRTGTVSVTLHTNQGDIPLTLDRADAPCGVVSFVHLVTAKFYDNTPCHRLVMDPNLKVLQCGDPTGTGTGGPGYTTPDENPTFLRPSPQDPHEVIYQRGTVAMANTGQPHSGGSQFFLVFGASTLPPSYTVLGTVDPAGLAVVDRVAAAGDDGSNSPGDGKPKLPVTIQQAQLTPGPPAAPPSR